MTSAPVFIILDTVDSTNNYAMEAIQAGKANHGMMWFANEQTAGKGQRGKTWASEKGQNIAMSIVLQPGLLPISNPFHLSAAVAVCCFEFVKRYAGEETKIKWPNDMYWRDRKAGGILIENTMQGNKWKWAVVGIGINVNQTGFDPFLANPVSLKQITGKDLQCIDLAAELHSLLLQYLSANNTASSIMEAYNEHLYKKNKPVTLRKEGLRFETVIKEVSPLGKLITVDSIEREFDFGEVEWIL